MESMTSLASTFYTIYTQFVRHMLYIMQLKFLVPITYTILFAKLVVIRLVCLMCDCVFFLK